ncbi:MAG: glycosyltransferase [Coriobacteriia bacterium]|nr:glycosyltransferase [Coriobacteriia bacterium]
MSEGLVANGHIVNVAVASSGKHALNSAHSIGADARLIPNWDGRAGKARLKRAQRIGIDADLSCGRQAIPVWANALALVDFCDAQAGKDAEHLIMVYPRSLSILLASIQAARVLGARLCICASEVIDESTMAPGDVDDYIQAVKVTDSLLWTLTSVLDDFWIQQGVSKERLFRNPPIVSSDWTACESGQEKNCTAIFIGNLADAYWGELVEIASHAKDMIPSFSLRLFGDYPSELSEARVKELEELGLTDVVRVNPPIARDEIPGALNRAHLALIPRVLNSAHVHGFPNKLAEALMCAIPVVVGNTGDIGYYLTSEECELVEPGDTIGYAEAMKEIVDSPGAAQEMAQRGMMVARSLFSADKVMARFIKAASAMPRLKKIELTISEGERRRIVFRYPDAKNLFVSSGSRDVGGAPVQVHTVLTRLAKNRELDVYLWVDGVAPQGTFEGVKLISGRDPLQGRFILLKRIRNKIRMERGNKFASDGVTFFTVSNDDGNAAHMQKLLNMGGKVAYRFASDYAIEPERYGHGDRTFFFEVLSRLSAIITQTQSQKSLLRKVKGLDSIIINSTFPLKEQQCIALADRKYDVVWIGQCRWYKQPWLVLEIARQFPDERFLMIMPEFEPSTAVAIKDQMSRMPNVDFIDFVPPSEVQSYYNDAKIILNTSLFEGYPNTLHGAAQAKAAYLSLCWEADELFGAEGVGLCSHGDVSTCIEQLRYLLDNPVILEQMGQRSYEHLRDVNCIDHVASQYEELIDRVLNEEQ